MLSTRTSKNQVSTCRVLPLVCSTLRQSNSSKASPVKAAKSHVQHQRVLMRLPPGQLRSKSHLLRQVPGTCTVALTWARICAGATAGGVFGNSEGVKSPTTSKSSTPALPACACALDCASGLGMRLYKGPIQSEMNPRHPCRTLPSHSLSSDSSASVS